MIGLPAKALGIAAHGRRSNEAWIAADSARERATVVTYDRHFEAIDRVGVLVLDATGGGAETR